MGRKHDSFYFENFTMCADFACRAAHMLHDALKDFDPDDLEARLAEIHKAEHGADEKKHELMNVLAHAFITPIEREDIIQMSQNIDEITDKIEDVLLRIYCNNIREMRPDALELVDIVIRICEETKLMLGEFAQLPPLEDAAHAHHKHQQHGRRGRPPVSSRACAACTRRAATPSR